MNFFYDKDWLNRNIDSYAFQWDHLVFIALAMILGIALALFLRKKDHKIVKIVLICIWGFYCLMQIIYYPIKWTQGEFNKDTMLPLHSCLMFMYVFPFAMFAKNKIIKTAACNFLVVVNMIMGFITLFVGCPGEAAALSYFGLHTLIYHSIDVIVPLVMIITKLYDIHKKDILYGLALFGILSAFIYVFDIVTGCDYFYFYDGHVFPAFKFISENVPHHILWSLLIISCYVITAVAMHFMIIGIKYLIEKRNQKSGADDHSQEQINQ